MTTPAPVEFLYGVRSGGYDGNDTWQPASVVAFRITKKTDRRIYYDANTINGQPARVRYVDRQALEARGEVTRKSGAWWEPDLTVYMQPPQTWPPSADLDLTGLKAEMAAAHPDRGGTDESFIAARRRYQQALSQEVA